ncbi:MAG: DUF4351 domain-containing protein [Lautropia sp.]|nr:DUF4351 domain-containing protein [Lautropia sp.]
MSITHDQNFKNLIVDYPVQALQFFVTAEAPQAGDLLEITPIRQELLKDRLSDRFFELDVPLRLEWKDGRREILLFVLEEQSDPRKFSIYKLAVYCVQLAEQMKIDRVVPVVIFLRSSRNRRPYLRLGSEHQAFLSFHYIFSELDQLPAEQYFQATNIVARILLPLMRYSKGTRSQVFWRSAQGIVELEPDPEKQAKYLDFLDKALPLTDNERQQYERDFPQEQHIMATLTERWKAEGRQDGIRQGIQQGIQQGIEQGIQQGEQQGRQQLLIRMLEKRFGSLDVGTVERLQAASTAELDQWGERILDAEHLEDVFRVH